MRNPEGTPIWYELLASDAATSTAFYEEVIGWKVLPPRPDDEMRYRVFDTAHGYLGGMMELDEKMRSNGAKPTWLFYVGVEDVDATVRKVEAEGGKVLMAPFDLPEIGRIAMIADPQGIPLYVMRGASDQPSTAFERQGMGRLTTTQQSRR